MSDEQKDAAHREWRKQANARIMRLEQQLADAAAAGDEALTKRERFAMFALQGMLAAGAPADEEQANVALQAFATLAVDFADSLLAALEAKP